MKVVAWIAPGTWDAVVATASKRPQTDRITLVAVADNTQDVPSGMLSGLMGRAHAPRLRVLRQDQPRSRPEPPRSGEGSARPRVRDPASRWQNRGSGDGILGGRWPAHPRPRRGQVAAWPQEHRAAHAIRSGSCAVHRGARVARRDPAARIDSRDPSSRGRPGELAPRARQLSVASPTEPYSRCGLPIGTKKLQFGAILNLIGNS